MLSREREQGLEGETGKRRGRELLGCCGCCCCCCERLFLYSPWQALLLPGKVGYRAKELSPDAGREAASYRESKEAPLPLTVRLLLIKVFSICTLPSENLFLHFLPDSCLDLMKALLNLRGERD